MSLTGDGAGLVKATRDMLAFPIWTSHSASGPIEVAYRADVTLDREMVLAVVATKSQHIILT